MANNEASPFESSDMLATFVASTPLLAESWRLCNHANTSPAAHRSFVAERIGRVAYVALSGVQMVGGCWYETWRNMVALDRMDDVAVFSCIREGEEPVMVHAGILNLFNSLLHSFKTQMLEILENKDTKSVVITGHSIGGATASLCTLWLLSYLRSITSCVSVLCITYGSPLLGNNSFSTAICRERWSGNFCHVVSKHDIMPRLLFAPITPLTSQLNFLLQFWQLSMTSPDFGKLAVQITDKEKAELFTAVMDYSEAATQGDEEGESQGEASATILFRPFGNYLFVSEFGAVCMDSPAAITKMMHLMLATGSPDCSIEDHLKYGDYVDKVSWQFLTQGNSSMQRSIPESSYEAGLELAIQSSGLANQESLIIPAMECLKATRRMGPSPVLNAAALAVSLSKVAPFRAQIEWYKALCDEQDEQAGYYDSFKSRSCKKSMKVNINRFKLARFWNDVIEMMEKNELPHDFDKRAKWVNASHSYKLLVEPLDIAEYYRKGLHRTNGHYMENGNRARRYEMFDRWWKDRTRRDGATEENSERSTFASLTQDSCFWAKVEEARDWLDSVRSESDTNKLALLWDKIEKFEVYANQLIEQKEVSKDVLAKNSSYSIWVGDLRELKQLREKLKVFPHQLTSILDGEVVP
ncbi:Lipase-like pad4 [Stylosanthes scabra]|uniref:Lipase-like pad4 n=1 Tax=Stylosanthes scabra TaxID=79078 RepID=A0ABU6SFN0_9FABA|nr:Lipase-like pad4 [Stylosanthes scabra]